jgi:4-amino-4-deoxy-L-arabinose transferase-like glycosyltransferase
MSLSFARLDWGLIGILLLGFVLRLWGINFGLPYTYAPDEPTRMNVALTMLKTGDLNPHWLGYPHLAFYINAIGFFIYFLVGRLLGTFATPADIPYPQVVTIGVGKLAMPSEFLLSRGISVLFGTAAIVLVFLIGIQVSKRRAVGLISALLFAVSPAATANSHLISLDSYGVFFLLVAFYWIYALLDKPTFKGYILAGIGTGLAFSGKYNVGLIGLTLVLVHFLVFGFADWKRKELYFAILFSGLAFALVNPFSVVDLGGFFRGLALASGSQSQFTGMANNSFRWYLGYLWNVEGWIIALAGIQAVRLLKTKSKEGLAILSFPIIYLVFVSQFSVANDRTILPIIPFLDVLSAMLIVDLVDWLVNNTKFSCRAVEASIAIGLTWVIIQPLQVTAAADLRLTQIDGRETARRWLESNLPDGTRVAQEGYSPYLDTQRFVVQGVDTIIRHPPEWYRQNGFEDVIVSQGIYGRLFADPASYQREIEQYKQFFTSFSQVVRFDDNGYEVRVYKTGVVLPSHRVAARYGDYGEHVELIGYDDAQWAQGDPLQVHLYWRTPDEKPEPYEVELRLLGQNDREIAKTRSDLFQGKGWQSGMFNGTWTVVVPPETAPGSYRLQINVIWMRYAYSMPAQSWTGQRIDPVILGPIEMSAH